MSGRMSILCEDDVAKIFGKPVDDRHHLIAAWYGKGAVRTEVVLHVNHNEGRYRGSRNLQPVAPPGFTISPFAWPASRSLPCSNSRRVDRKSRLRDDIVKTMHGTDPLPFDRSRIHFELLL